ncbi:MAG TPA: response regulator, partial [Acidobacteria bacterium]|nr:response regulator [Acidobacteriota bacterium]
MWPTLWSPVAPLRATWIPTTSAAWIWPPSGKGGRNLPRICIPSPRMPEMERVLFVDDEANILSGIRRNLRRRYEVFTAEGGQAGLEALEREGPFAVVVSDYRMPGMDGVEFLARVRAQSPHSVRMMLTGQAEMSAVIGAINSSKIFRFLPKPISRDELIGALDDALEQYRLITAEKQLLEQTLSSSVKALVDLLGMVNPVAFSRAARVKRCVAWLVGRLEPPNPWEFELAGLLS